MNGRPSNKMSSCDLTRAGSTELGVACPVHRTPTGSAGVPSLEELCAELRREITG